MKFSRIVMSLALISAVGLASCGDSNSSSSSDTSIVDMKLVPAGNVIDVRSADEFAAGHVQGATNLDFENGDFEKSLAKLDKSLTYSLYCRSGRRSALAAELMRNAGFTNVVDLGAMEIAAKTLALPIVNK